MYQQYLRHTHKSTVTLTRGIYINYKQINVPKKNPKLATS